MKSYSLAVAAAWGVLLTAHVVRADVAPLRNEPPCPVGSQRQSLGAGHRACMPAACDLLDSCVAPNSCVVMGLCLHERPIHSGKVVREVWPATKTGCSQGGVKEFLRVCGPAAAAVLAPLSSRVSAELIRSNCSLPVLTTQRAQVVKSLEQCLTSLPKGQVQQADGGFALQLVGNTAKVGAHHAPVKPIVACLLPSLAQNLKDPTSSCTTELTIEMGAAETGGSAQPRKP